MLEVSFRNLAYFLFLGQTVDQRNITWCPSKKYSYSLVICCARDARAFQGLIHCVINMTTDCRFQIQTFPSHFREPVRTPSPRSESCRKTAKISSTAQSKHAIKVQP
ncbi:hypothetical protein XENORESO_004563 [Xenotaenia resolanae]|uniref:Transposase n=1 Tax=Xenotaenia resolanae TaxID=208358 RepID=A0ABV0VLT6_9TELE